MTERSWGTHKGWWLAGTGGCGSRMRKGRKMEVCRRSWVWGLFSGRGLCAGVCWREGEKQGGRYHQWSLLHKRGCDRSCDLLLFASCKRVRYKVMNYSLINRIVLSFKECFEYVCVPGTVFNAEQTVGPRQMWPIPMQLTVASRNTRAGWNLKDNLFNPLFHRHRNWGPETVNELDSYPSAI